MSLTFLLHQVLLSRDCLRSPCQVETLSEEGQSVSLCVCFFFYVICQILSILETLEATTAHFVVCDVNFGDAAKWHLLDSKSSGKRLGEMLTVHIDADS